MVLSSQWNQCIIKRVFNKGILWLALDDRLSKCVNDI